MSEQSIQKAARDEDIVHALLCCGSIKEAAEAVGVSESTIYRRLKDEALLTKYEEKRQLLTAQIEASISDHLIRGVTDAVIALRKIVRGEEWDTRPVDKVRAAEALLKAFSVGNNREIRNKHEYDE